MKNNKYWNKTELDFFSIQWVLEVQMMIQYKGGNWKSNKEIKKEDKSSGEDQTVNKYLKHSFYTIFDIHVKLFNAIFDSGSIPEQ